MKWYDYLACLWFAEILSAGLIFMDIFLLTLGIFLYMLYENLRKD